MALVVLGKKNFLPVCTWLHLLAFPWLHKRGFWWSLRAGSSSFGRRWKPVFFQHPWSSVKNLEKNIFCKCVCKIWSEFTKNVDTVIYCHSGFSVSVCAVLYSNKTQWGPFFTPICWNSHCQLWALVISGQTALRGLSGVEMWSPVRQSRPWNNTGVIVEVPPLLSPLERDWRPLSLFSPSSISPLPLRLAKVNCANINPSCSSS